MKTNPEGGRVATNDTDAEVNLPPETQNYEYMQGYRKSWLMLGADDDADDDMPASDGAQGYCVLATCDLNDPFAAFETPKKGVVGGDKTVDDFTTAGLEW